MTDNTTELDFGTTAQKATDAEKLPVVLLALDQGRYDMARSLDAVSYTHLTLPTKRIVEISGGAGSLKKKKRKKKDMRDRV